MLSFSENNDIEKLKNNQSLMWDVLKEITLLMKSTNQKLDLILTGIKSLKLTEKDQTKNNEDVEFLSCLPAELDDFEALNEKISGSPSFQQYVVLLPVIIINIYYRQKY